MEKNAVTRKAIWAPLADDRLTAAREEARTEKGSKEPADRRREEEGSGKEKTEGSLKIFSDVLSSLREAVIITDARGRLEHMNRKAQNLTGWSLREAANRPLPEVFRIKDNLVAAWEEIPAGRTSSAVLCHREGGEYAIEYSAAWIPDGLGQTRGCVIVFHDVTEKGNLLRDMTHRAHFDALTDLPNRYLLKDRFSQAIARARRQGQILVLYFLDLDHFKKINDSLGHPAGDRILKETAHRLRSAVRETDTVARLGGDEFAILAGDMKSLDDAIYFAGKVRAALVPPMKISREHPVTVSIGAAIYPIDGNSLTRLLRNADLAMYQAKKSGRNRIKFYSESLVSQGERRVCNMDSSQGVLRP